MVNFPTNLDNFTNPNPTDKVNNPSVKHSTQHANANDAIEALEAKVGINGSAVTTSHDYKLGEVISTDRAVGKTATQTLTNKTLTSPSITNKTSTGTDNGVETLVNKTLTSPTLTTPTIASFANANHNHQDSAGGGTLSESALALTDVTTNNVSITKHGFVPKAPNNTSNYLRGDGTWATISGVNKFGGTGTDSALSITSGAFNIDLGGVRVFVKNYTSISITGTGYLTFTNSHANGTIIILKSQGNVTITTSATRAIDLRSLGGAGGASILAGDGSGAGGASIINNGVGVSTGGGNPGTSTLTLKDRTITGGVTVTPGARAYSNISIYTKSIELGAGSGGAGLSGATGYPGGNGGGALYIECAGSYSCSGTIDASGGAGLKTGTNRNSGGGGGGSIVILYNTLTSNTGTYNVAGGISPAGGIYGDPNGGDGYSLIALNTEFQ